MTRRFGILGLIIGLATVLAAAPALAQPVAIWKGLDTWYTPAGGAQVTVSVPAGYFCGGTSAPQTLTVSLKGKPIASVPSLAPSDTVIERPADAYFVNEVATTQLRMVGLSLEQNGAVSINCGGYTQLWNARVGLAGAQGFGTITITRTDPGGGTFNASFPVKGQVIFTNVANGQVRGPLFDSQTIATVGACWTHAPGPSSVVVGGPISLDSDANGTLDYTTPNGTGPNFWPGTCGPIKHTGPHPTTCEAPGPDCPEDEPNPCPDPWVHQYLKASADKSVGGFVFSNDPSSDSPLDDGPVLHEGDDRQPMTNSALVHSAQIDQKQLDRAVIDICVASVGARYLN